MPRLLVKTQILHELFRVKMLDLDLQRCDDPVLVITYEAERWGIR